MTAARCINCGRIFTHYCGPTNRMKVITRVCPVCVGRTPAVTV